MNNNEKYKIISNNYADLLIEYNRNMEALESNPNFSYNLINEKYAVLHIPSSDMTENSISQFGYAAIPKCYGLMTFYPNELISGFTIHEFPSEKLTGKGVLVGFVDTGIVYTNPIFQYPDKTSKIISIWDQSIESDNSYPEGIYYGTEYNREQINTALKAENPLNVVPSTDIIGEGTAMAGISAGFYDLERKFAGEAINAELVIVKLKLAKPYLKDFFGIPDQVTCYQENDIIMGINYLLKVANRLHRPIAICLGIGSSQGSHKGEDIMSHYLTEIGSLTGNAITLSAGTEGNQKHHYFGEIISPNYNNQVELNVGMNDKSFSLELWGYPSDLLSVDIYSPAGKLIYSITNDIEEQKTFTIINGSTIIYIDNIINEIYSEEQLILFRFKNIEEGMWRFRIFGSGNITNKFNMWLPMRNFLSEDTFFNNASPYTTICHPGNTLNALTVTSYYPPDRTLDNDASKGFTSDNIPKPNIAAPGVNIFAPTITNTLMPFSGTSIAAAHAAGIVAGLLEWGIVNGNLPSMNSTIIRYMITSLAQRLKNEIYPNPDWGYGLIV